MRAIQFLDSRNMTIGHAALGMQGDRAGRPAEQVHDGDTVTVRAVGDFGVRLLGIDTPEVSLSLPQKSGFTPLRDPRWAEYLRDPWAPAWGNFPSPLPDELRAYLAPKFGPACAANHARHADLARLDLVAEIEQDQRALQQDDHTFGFFLVFGYEVTDGYGRLLAFLNRDQPDPQHPGPRPRSYNERLLMRARAVPYFIWPNINPFRREDSIWAAVPRPVTAAQIAQDDASLREARDWTRRARQQQLGVYAAGDPLQLEPFELRFLSRRVLPDRWLIDLSRNDDTLVPPSRYHTIRHPEDRLWIPAEFVPLFAERGWKKAV